jgi:prephenate dehydrogenase
MWVPIFLQNRENVLDVLEEHIEQLQRFRDLIRNEDEEGLRQLMDQANGIKRILG